MGKNLEHKKDIWMINKHMEICSTSLSSEKYKSKPNTTSHPVEWLKLIRLFPNSKTVGQLKLIYIAVGSVNWYTHSGKFIGSFLFIYLFWPHNAACGISVPQPGIEPLPSAVKAQNPNHWTTREFPIGCFLYD